MILDAPVEIWTQVISPLSLQDLTRVALVSSSFLTIARSILYQSVVLRSDNNATKRTFDLLARDRTVANGVTTLHLVTVFRKHWIKLRGLAGMTRLKSLQLSGCPFYTDAELQIFVKTIQESCPFLVEFSYCESPKLKSNEKPRTQWQFPGSALEISGLQRMTWDEIRESDAALECRPGIETDFRMA
jgi:hypothetical protein